MVKAIQAETDTFRPSLPGDWTLQPAPPHQVIRVHFRWIEKNSGIICTITFAPKNILDVPLYAILLQGGWMEYYLNKKGENVHPLKVGVSER